MLSLPGRRRLVAASSVAALALAGTASAAFIGLPPDGSQINNDPANAIDPNQDAGLNDVTAGSLAAGGPSVPWAAFEQKTGAAQRIFVRAFKNGAWSTQGQSLNVQANQVAQAPAIDFAGAGRTVPWTTWAEADSHLGTGAETNIFASRFDATANVWIAEGQDRAPANRIPSLNLNPDRTAENPSVAGGTTNAANAPGPWVTWQEHDGATPDATAKPQIFVARAIKQTDCSGNKPGAGTSVSQFCWQQVGIERIGKTSLTPAADPSLSIDHSRDAVEPDIAFTGPSDTVPWVVWYEETPSGIGLRDNQQVFAAKAVPDAAADGGFHWQAVGNGTAGQVNVLDTSGAAHQFGPCTESTAAEDRCTLNSVATHDGENARVAAGSLAVGGATVPWITWDEDNGSGIHQVFVSRLVGGDHFEVFNNGQPISNIANDSIRPDITFSGHTPYVSWRESVGTAHRTFVGHFEGGAASPVFKLDTPGGVPDSVELDAPLRAPLSSGCAATPFNGDGDACQGAAVGTPFFLHLDQTAGTPQRLRATAYAPSDVTTGAASAVTQSTAALAGSLNPGGAATRVRFEFGTSPAYGSQTADQTVGPATTPVAVSATLSGLPAGTAIHYRLVATTDFTTIAGADQTLTTQPAPVIDKTPPHVGIVSRRLTMSARGIVRVRLSCPAVEKAGCRGTVTLRTVRRFPVVGGRKGKRRVVTLGRARFVIRAGTRRNVSIRLSRRNRARVRHAHRLQVRVVVRATDPAGNVGITTKRLPLRPARRRR